MPLYEFRCPHCGVFEAMHHMSEVPGSRTCRNCSETAVRVFSPIGLSALASDRAKAIGDAERSAHEPEIVTRVPNHPGGSQPRTTQDPRHLNLPRP